MKKHPDTQEEVSLFVPTPRLDCGDDSAFLAEPYLLWQSHHYAQLYTCIFAKTTYYKKEMGLTSPDQEVQGRGTPPSFCCTHRVIDRTQPLYNQVLAGLGMGKTLVPDNLFLCCIVSIRPVRAITTTACVTSPMERPMVPHPNYSKLMQAGWLHC